MWSGGAGISGVKKSCRDDCRVCVRIIETGRVVSSTGVAARSPSAAASGVLRSGSLQFTAVTGPQSFISAMAACVMPLLMEQGAETGSAGWGCAITHGAAAATSHNDVAVASKPRATGFILFRNQRNMSSV